MRRSRLYGRDETAGGEDGEAIVGVPDGFADCMVALPGRGVGRLADMSSAGLSDGGIS